jgi:hypothetical protein
VDKAYSARDLPCSRKLARMIGGDVTCQLAPSKDVNHQVAEIFARLALHHTVHGRERNLSG